MVEFQHISWNGRTKNRKINLIFVCTPSGFAFIFLSPLAFAPIFTVFVCCGKFNTSVFIQLRAIFSLPLARSPRALFFINSNVSALFCHLLNGYFWWIKWKREFEYLRDVCVWWIYRVLLVETEALARREEKNRSEGNHIWLQNLLNAIHGNVKNAYAYSANLEFY